MSIGCKVDGCERDAMYKKQQVCQMHYFRMMRTGSYDLKERAKNQRYVTPSGYVKVLSESHVFADKYGYVYEHRLKLYEKHGGDDLKCEFCGADWRWRPYHDHVDHIDENKGNNSIENLRPLCNSCNTRRTKVDLCSIKGANPITAFGKTLVSTEWEKEPECVVQSSTLRQRINAGWDPERAITKPSNKSSSTKKGLAHEQSI